MEKNIGGKLIGFAVLAGALALVGGCGSGGTGGGDGDNPSGITDQGGSVPPQTSAQKNGSPDIYNPDVYESVKGADESGTYLLVQRGTASITSNAGLKTEAHEAMNISRRNVIQLKSVGINELHVFDLCTGKDWGEMNDFVMLTQSADSEARFTGHYQAHFDEISTVSSEQDGNPMLFFETTRESVEDPILTNVDYIAEYDLVRIGDVNSSIGRAQLSYTLGGGSPSLNVCWGQMHLAYTLTFPNYSAPNSGDYVADAVYAHGSDSATKFEMVMGSGDAFLAGIGPIGTGNAASFRLALETPTGKSVYADGKLTEHGETGQVNQSMIANDSWDLEFTGAVTPNDSGKYEKDSLPATYHFDMQLK